MNISIIENLLNIKGLTNEETGLLIEYIKANYDSIKNRLDMLINSLPLENSNGTILDTYGTIIGLPRRRLVPIVIPENVVYISINGNFDDIVETGYNTIYLPRTAIYLIDDDGNKYYLLDDIFFTANSTTVTKKVIFFNRSNMIGASKINRCIVNFTKVVGIKSSEISSNLITVTNNTFYYRAENSFIQEPNDSLYKYRLISLINSKGLINSNFIMSKLLEIDGVVRIHISKRSANGTIFYVETRDPTNDSAIIDMCKEVLKTYNLENNIFITRPVYNRLKIIISRGDPNLVKDAIKSIVENASMGEKIELDMSSYNIVSIYVNNIRQNSGILMPYWNEKYIVDEIEVINNE